MKIQEEIDRATALCQELEDIIVKRRQFPNGYRDQLLGAHWALVFDYDKSILCLLMAKYYGGAFALLRPLVEALVRSHIVILGTEEDVCKIKHDEYRTYFQTVGKEIDKLFGTDTLLDTYLNGMAGVLHSFTHSGLSQLARRFKKGSLDANYKDAEIYELIHHSTSAVWMVTNVLAKTFKFEEEAKRCEQLYIAWAQVPRPDQPAAGE
jgi:hypothetical protein